MRQAFSLSGEKILSDDRQDACPTIFQCPLSLGFVLKHRFVVIWEVEAPAETWSLRMALFRQEPQPPF